MQLSDRTLWSDVAHSLGALILQFEPLARAFALVWAGVAMLTVLSGDPSTGGVAAVAAVGLWAYYQTVATLGRQLRPDLVTPATDLRAVDDQGGESACTQFSR